MSEIEWYLDELFGQLDGTGAAGRRALIEAEYHLGAATAGAMARGLPQDQAEHEAVSRFGPPALVARKLRSAQGAGRPSRAVSAAWLLAGLAGCGLGAAYLVAAWWHTRQAPDCYLELSYGCYTAGMLVTRITTATTFAAAGAALLLGRWLTVRYAALTSRRRGFALLSRR
ncbi:MAG: permease prefix domain 1-containing protein [Streptosporangiaceae bacterium]